jgi:hypothetical protein
MDSRLSGNDDPENTRYRAIDELCYGI